MNIKINAMLHRETFDGWKINTRCIQDYELVYIIRGYGEIQIIDKQISVRGGDLICFSPGISHSLWLENKPYMEFYGVHFDFSETSLMKEMPEYIHFESAHWLEIQMRNLYQEYQQKNYLSKWKQEILLQQILCEVLAKRHAEQEPASNKRINKVLVYIHEDPFREYTLADLLEHTGIKKSLFLKSFHEVTGTTPIQYIIDIRLEQAKELLSETDLQISLISEKCGFSDPFYFSRCFKKRFALSPRQYREYKKND